ncbi:AAA family ATPase [Desulfobacula sp.]|uniref:AAA family ATPase n=1 Tax=Desulfobacula sp. TaxID=2593537 RepID=UPI00260DAEE9|nr:AAA family ATPase [Desulfobacula sp.]
MSRLFLGKISKKYPIQFDDNFYAAGKPDSKWYNAIKPGDYVFPIYNAKVQKLWKVRKYSEKPNTVNEEGMVEFDVIKEFPSISVSTEFLQQKYFELNLNTINKSVKSAETGFFEISVSEDCPAVEEIDFNQTRNIYIVLNSLNESPTYEDHDIRMIIDRKKDYKIQSIEVFNNTKFETYLPLWELYESRNQDNERYTLTELLQYAEKDNATKKLKYIRAVLEDLQEKGYFSVTSPVALYDNIIVGRKRSYVKKKADEIEVLPPEDEDQEDDSLEDYGEYKELLEYNPNLILYGPPGTGKTYAAQRIIEYIEKERCGVFKPFETILSDDRVEFITFHQSYSYEEFVEGIRPVFNDDDIDSTNETHLRYQVADGIIKKLSNRAALSQLTENADETDITNIGKNSTVYKISLGQRTIDENIYNDCIDNNYIAIGWFASEDLTNSDYDSIYDKLIAERGPSAQKPTNDASSIHTFVNTIRKGDIVFIYDGPLTIRDIGIVTGEYRYEKNIKHYPHRRDVKWIKHFDTPYEIFQYNGGVRLTLKTVYPLTRIQFTDISEILKTGEIHKKAPSKTTNSPCYLIIDEINRGNISKIFGELITLIEKDKRDVLSVTLPYSRKPFKLPSNIYIIGTMNTADRSIAILDTALRRRFTFCEIEPNDEVIEKNGNNIIENEIDLAKLLKKLNLNIQKYYDRDHRIGHAYFLELFNYRALYTTWYYKIIPLLMEYFYNDNKNVAAIITDKFIGHETSQIKRLEKKEFISAIRGIYEA